MRRLFATIVIITVSLTAGSALAATANSLQSANASLISPQDSGVLQPAGSSNASLQATGSSGVSQSGTENLQQSGASDQMKLLIQSGAGVPHTLSNSGADLSWLGDIVLVLLIATVATGAVWWWQRGQTMPASS